MKKIIKHYPMTDRLIVRRGYFLSESAIKAQRQGHRKIRSRGKVF